MFNFFEELFSPGRKHASDERKRLELSRVDLNTGDPGRGPIDLASGKVVVRPHTGEEHHADDEPEPSGEAEGPQASPPGGSAPSSDGSGGQDG